jgi:hypothetical protein
VKGRKYIVIKSDPSNGLFQGQQLKPYYENEIEIIVNGPRPDIDHHIRKNGSYFSEHIKEEAV